MSEIQTRGEAAVAAWPAAASPDRAERGAARAGRAGCFRLPAAGIDGLAAEWQALADRGEAPAVAGPAWARAFARAFTTARDRVEIHALRGAGGLQAALPLRFVGGAFRAWRLLENEHSPYASAALAVADRGAVAAVLEQALADAESAVFARLHEDGAVTRALLDAAASLGARTRLARHDLGDALIPIEGPWEEQRRRLPRNILHDLPRKSRKLERAGTVTFERLVDPGPALDAALEECFLLETRGWKGVSGSPIAADPRTRRFYTELAAGAAAAGGFALYLLRLDGRLLAFEYCLRAGGRLDMLKLSYDPEFSSYSPGGVLRLRILEAECADGAVRSYHLGRPSPWKMRWAAAVRPLCTLRIYGRGPRARAAYAWEVEARNVLKRLPWLRALAARRAAPPRKAGAQARATDGDDE